MTFFLTNFLLLCICNPDIKSKKMIEVCCAIILKESEILAVQRGPESSHPWKWKFPGGKINPFETDEQCVVREISEEIRKV